MDTWKYVAPSCNQTRILNSGVNAYAPFCTSGSGEGDSNIKSFNTPHLQWFPHDPPFTKSRPPPYGNQTYRRCSFFIGKSTLCDAAYSAWRINGFKFIYVEMQRINGTPFWVKNAHLRHINNPKLTLCIYVSFKDVINIFKHEIFVMYCFSKLWNPPVP